MVHLLCAKLPWHWHGGLFYGPSPFSVPPAGRLHACSTPLFTGRSTPWVGSCQPAFSRWDHCSRLTFIISHPAFCWSSAFWCSLFDHHQAGLPVQLRGGAAAPALLQPAAVQDWVPLLPIRRLPLMAWVLGTVHIFCCGHQMDQPCTYGTS